MTPIRVRSLLVDGYGLSLGQEVVARGDPNLQGTVVDIVVQASGTFTTKIEYQVTVSISRPQRAIGKRLNGKPQDWIPAELPEEVSDAGMGRWRD